MDIDVIYVTYGCQDLTLLSLQHLFAYTPANLRIILADNAAGEAHLSHQPMGQMLRGGDIYISNPNIGVYQALNNALALVKTDWVILSSSDFMVFPGWFSACEDAIRRGLASWVSPAWIEAPYSPKPAWECLQQQYPEKIETGRFCPAFALFDWARIREAVGYWDTRFFFTYGDADYQERFRDAKVEAGVIHPARALHVGGASRKLLSPGLETMLEMWDEEIFYHKWAGRQDVMERHPAMPTGEWGFVLRAMNCLKRGT